MTRSANRLAAMIARDGPISIAALQRRTGFASITIIKALRDLENAGLIERETSRKSRAIAYRPTGGVAS